MKRMIKSLVVSVIALAVMLFGATAAFGQEITTEDVTYSQAAASSTVKTVERVDTATKVELEHVSSVGINRPKATGCKLVSSWSKKPAGAKCFRLKRGGKFVTKARNRDGNLVDLYTYVGAPTSSSPDASWMMFVLRNGKWIKAGDEHGHGNCGNPSRGPGNPPKLTWKVTQEFKSFSSIKYKVGIDVYEKGKVTATATATCNTSSSSATASAEAELWIRVYVYVYAKYSSHAKINGPGQITQDVKQDIRIKITAKALLKIEAEAKAWCTDSPEPEPEVTGDVICKNPPHLYAPDGNGIMVCELSRSDNVKPTLSQFSVEALNDYAYFAQPTEFGFREEAQVNPCPTNVLCVRVQVWAVSPGLFKYVAKFASYDQVDGQFMIEEDDF